MSRFRTVTEVIPISPPVLSTEPIRQPTRKRACQLRQLTEVSAQVTVNNTLIAMMSILFSFNSPLHSTTSKGRLC